MPNTVVITTRYDARVLADMAIYLKQRKIPFTNKSELVRNCLDYLHTNLVKQDRITPLENTEVALEMLSSIGITFEHNKARKRLLQQMQDESLTLDDLPIDSELASEIDKMRDSFK